MNKYLTSLITTTLSIALNGALIAEETCQTNSEVCAKAPSELAQRNTLQPSSGTSYQQNMPSPQQQPPQQAQGYYQQTGPSSAPQGGATPSMQQGYSQQQYTQQNTQFSNYGQTQVPGQIQWLMSYQQAVGAAKQQNKYILLFFTGSDWCGWCKKMESEVFSDPAFANAVGNRFVFVEVDFPMNRALPSDIAQQNSQLKQQYGITGYPTVVILDSNQNFVAEAGYRPGGGREYANYLMGLI